MRLSLQDFSSHEARNKLMHQIVVTYQITSISAMWSSRSLGRVDWKRFLVDSWSSTMHARFCLLDYGVCSLACSVLQPTWALLCSQFARHCRFHRYLQPFPRVSTGFLAPSIFPIDGISASQTSGVIELWCLNSPLSLLLFLSCFRHASPNIRPQVIRSGRCGKLCESLPGPHISLKKMLV